MLRIILIIIAFSISGIEISNAQCLSFVRTTGFEKLDTANYVPDGRLDAIPLSEGDSFEVYKSFFRNRKYKVVVVGENIENITFTVKNFQRQILFDSKEISENDFWEFTSDKNQNVIISVEIPSAKEGQEPKSGCIAVLVGYASK